MASQTSIEWTRGDDGTPGVTWNPVTGCDRVSPGCDNCYALTLAKRLKAMGAAKYQRDGDPRTSGPGFGVTIHPDVVNAPLRWRKPKRVFVNSMSDLFHKDVPDSWLADIFAVMAAARRHVFQVLTKRHGRARSLLSDTAWVEQVRSRATGKGLPAADWQWPLPGVWLGVSVEDQQRADLRIPALLETPAAVRFLSCEPLLGPVHLSSWLSDAAHLDDRSGRSSISWLICGGESGHRARPMDVAWAEWLVRQCQSAGVPVFVKQLGIRVGGTSHHDMATFPPSLQVREFPAPELLPAVLGAHAVTDGREQR